MAPSITLAMRDYDYLAPLACGDVTAERVDLTLRRDTPRALDWINDASVDAGELSLSKHIQRLASGDVSVVAIPFFAERAFCQRGFFVRRGSGLRDLRDLDGRRVGTNDWHATGNTWSRAALREAGVKIEAMRWWVGSLDGSPTRARGALPRHAQYLSEEQTLVGMLLAGELDALMCPSPPKGFYAADSPIIRLVADYKRAEREYYRRTGIYPLQHIVGVRRPRFEQDRWIARSLYDALERSKTAWQKSQRSLAETLPWILEEIEDITVLMGDDWLPNGVAVNRRVVQLFLDEQVAQGLIATPLPFEALFTEFEETAGV
jgi:4,5-dihydroxyphthalate decarboxylase